MLREYRKLACSGIELGRFFDADRRVTPSDLDVLARARLSSQLPPVSAARSTITLPRAISCTISPVTRIGALRPGDGRSRDHDVGGGDLLADELSLAAKEVLGLLPGVAALAFLGLELELDEGRAEALHLVSAAGRTS